jgi:hypothetical protein
VRDPPILLASSREPLEVRMAKHIHREEYLVLAGVTHKSALVTWGAIHLKAKEAGGRYKVLDEEEGAVEKLNPPRFGQIGLRSGRYAEQSVRVGLKRVGSTQTEWKDGDPARNHLWIYGLQADTPYEYEVEIDGKPWAAETLDWDPDRKWHQGKGYTNRFLTLPDPESAPPSEVTFAVIGDYGVGIDKSPEQWAIAKQLTSAVESGGSEGRPPVRFVVTAGDNVYAHRFLIFGSAQGDEDDDWFFPFYQPYRYILNRIQFFPCVGNHDAQGVPWEGGEDDRRQLNDNFYLEARLAGEPKAGRASADPRDSFEGGLFYKLDVCPYLELVCLDSTERKGKPYVSQAAHAGFMTETFPASGGTRRWKIPFFHHPVFCKGPMHGDTKGIGHLARLFQEAGVKLVLAGHEHNYQHLLHEGIHYVVSGGAAKLREGPPAQDFRKSSREASLVDFAVKHHFLLVTVKPETIHVRAIGADGGDVAVPIEIT